jgi:hypothetical protein
MATIKSYTDIEQSKKLAEILPLESADMHWQYIEEDNGQLQWFCFLKDFSINQHSTVSAWSLAALMNLLPSEFTEKGKYSETTYQIDIRKYALTDDIDIYQIAYGNYKFYEDGNSSWKDMISTSQKENLLDVAFEMICWLKENNGL